jgi:hypothetical protein
MAATVAAMGRSYAKPRTSHTIDCDPVPEKIARMWYLNRHVLRYR